MTNLKLDSEEPLDVGGEYAYRIRGEKHSWSPSTITNCFNVSQNTMSFYDGNASTNRTAHYVNSATTSNILTFNQNYSIFAPK